jgi:glutathione S-transferase
MITLFVKTGCPFCARVLAEVETLHLRPTIKNVADPAVVEELIRIGGHARTPFMIDDETGVQLYGSAEIVQYLHERFGKHV